MESRSSTRLGNALGGAMRGAAFVFDYALPLVAVSAYRLIPDARRGQLFGGPSASLDVVRTVRQAGGGGWAAIRAAASNHPPRPPLPPR
jgi:hypothetical protein